MNSRIGKNIGLTMFTLFFFWHAIAIAIVGPFYKSELRDTLYPFFSVYLTVTELDRSWGYYAPYPDPGSMLRYETVAEDGTTELHYLSEAPAKFDHAYFRHTNFYVYLFKNLEDTRQKGYDKSVAAYLCSRHEEEKVSSINFILVKQKKFSHLDYRKGKRPLDLEFLEEKSMGNYPC